MLSRLPSFIYRSSKKHVSLKACAWKEIIIPSSATLSSVCDADTFGSLKDNLEEPNVHPVKKPKELSRPGATKIPRQLHYDPKTINRNKGNKPEIFGDISQNDTRFKIMAEAERTFSEDSECLPSERFIPKVKRKRFTDYAREIRQLSREGKTKEAIELFESLEGLGVTYRDNRFLYIVIISACGKVGYTKKAFQIYAKMRQRQLIPSPAVLTGLFNACAECPFPKYGLEKAQGLHRKMLEEGWHPSQITYHAMIKAYGRCGDLASAFILVDEMKKGGFAITEETFSFLLQACISDKEAGFTHAVSVLRKMYKMLIKPSLYNYNLLLRTVRDCGVGPSEIASKLLLDWPQKPLLSNPTKVPLLPGTNQSSSSQQANNNLGSSVALPSKMDHSAGSLAENHKSLQLREIVFDVLAPRPPGTNILALGDIKTSADRLALLGGPNRILARMVKLNHKPNIQMVTLLLECQESSTVAETSLLEVMKENGVRPDIDFFNVLLKKRCSRWDYKSARAVLDLIAEHCLYPDIATFGTLAMTCHGKGTSRTLVRDMVKSGFTPNIKVLGALMKNAFRSMDFAWMQYLMEEVIRHDVRPCEVFLGQLENAWKNATRALVSLERGSKEVPAWAEAENFQDDFKQFCLGYKKWLKTVLVELPEHPWNQYKPEVKKSMDNI